MYFLGFYGNEERFYHSGWWNSLERRQLGNERHDLIDGDERTSRNHKRAQHEGRLTSWPRCRITLSLSWTASQNILFTFRQLHKETALNVGLLF